MTKRLCLPLLPLLITGCAIGMSADRFRAAHRAAGVEAHLMTAAGTIRGELLEVRPDALVVATSGITWKSDSRGEVPDRQLRLVPFAAIQQSEFEQLGSSVRVSNGQAPRGASREQLRLASRFPYGIEPAVLANLLKAHGQTALGGIDK